MNSSQAAPQRRKKKPGSTNLVLAAVLFVVCGAAYWLETHKQSDAAREFANKPKLFQLDATQEVESVTIVDQDKGVNVALKCLNRCKMSDPAAEWQLTAPIDFKADASNVGSFISGLASANVQETVPIEAGDAGEAALKQFGLDKDKRQARKATFKFKKDATAYEVYLGDAAAVGDNVYALAIAPGGKADTVKIVPGFTKTNLERPLSYWRSKKLFDLTMADIEGFRLKTAVDTIELAKAGNDWQLGPKKELADNEAVDTWLTGLIFLNAHEFLTDDKAKDASKFGITPKTPHYAVTLHVAKKPDVSFDVYDFVKDKAPHVEMTFSDRSYIVSLDHTAAAKFAKSYSDFRFHRLLTAAEKEQIRRIDLRLADQKTYSFKWDNGWSLVGGTIAEFEASRVDEALAKLATARIIDFKFSKPLPKESPELSSWTLLDKDGHKIRTLTFYGSSQSGEYFLRAQAGSASKPGDLQKLDRTTASAVAWRIESFQKPKPPGAAVAPGAAAAGAAAGISMPNPAQAIPGLPMPKMPQSQAAPGGNQ